MFQTCDTGFDLLSTLGEVTNAYITIQNIGEREVKDIQMLLKANDEQKPYTKQSFDLQYLPPGYEITVKLTADSDSKIPTVLTFSLDGDPGVHETLTKDNCNNRLPDFERIDALGALYKVVPIQ